MISRPPFLIAVLGPTASGKSALALTLAERLGGEVVSCDSAAVYRGCDIGTDKVPTAEQRGIPHHLVDVADATEEYTAARYARDAAMVVRDIRARGRVPIVAGGTGFYFRALTRGLFPGPERDPQLRARLRAVAARRGVEFLHRMVARIDPPSGLRILPRDYMRLERALEVFFLTGRTLTDHFAATVSPLPEFEVIGFWLNPPAARVSERIARRVDGQFERGFVAEVQRLLDRGIPPGARIFTMLGYRQILEHLQGLRDEPATREEIVRETRHYARRQLIWFRKEPNLEAISGLGDLPETVDAAARIIDRRFRGVDAGERVEENR